MVLDGFAGGLQDPNISFYLIITILKQIVWTKKKKTTKQIHAGSQANEQQTLYVGHLCNNERDKGAAVALRRDDKKMSARWTASKSTKENFNARYISVVSFCLEPINDLLSILYLA